MDASTIKCPHCQKSFPLTDAISQPIFENVRAQVTAEVEQRARAGLAGELTTLKDQLAQKDQSLVELRNAELKFRKDREKLIADRAGFELEKQRALDAERAKIGEEAAKLATEEMTRKLEELRSEMVTKDEQLSTAQKNELELRQERTAFEERKKALDLEVARKADEVRNEVAKQKDEEFRLKEEESNAKLKQMKSQIDELKRKAEQGSQQMQGEVLEVDLESMLANAFPMDGIEPVAKGTVGADVIHVVKDERDSECGRIIWESKRTKAWSDGWIEKLKDDKIAAKAQIAVVVSTTLPKGLDGFGFRDGIWITSSAMSLSLAIALRFALIETACAKRAVEGRHDKISAVYDYVAGPEFKARVTAIVETFRGMKADLEAEKKAMLKIWAKREKQIDRIVANTAGLHGELQGIIGQSLPSIEALELDSIARLADGEAEASAEA